MSPTVAAVLACKGAEAEAENTIQQPAQKRNVGHVRGKKALSTCPLVHIAEEGFSCAVIQCFYTSVKSSISKIERTIMLFNEKIVK